MFQHVLIHKSYDFLKVAKLIQIAVYLKFLLFQLMSQSGLDYDCLKIRKFQCFTY